MARPRKSPPPVVEANTSDPSVESQTSKPVVLEGIGVPVDIDALWAEAEAEAKLQPSEDEGVETKTEEVEAITETPSEAEGPVGEKPIEVPKERVYTTAEVAKIQATSDRQIQAMQQQLEQEQARQAQAVEFQLQQREAQWLTQMEDIGQGDEAKQIVQRDRQVRGREAEVAKREQSLMQQTFRELPSLYVQYAKEAFGVEIDPKELYGLPPERIESAGMVLVGQKLKAQSEATVERLKEAGTPPVKPMSATASAAPAGLSAQRVKSMSNAEIVRDYDKIMDAMFEGKLK